MNFICAVLLLFADEEDVFWMLVCIIEDYTSFDEILYYQSDLAGVRIDLCVFKDLVQAKLPKIHQKLEELNVTIELLTINWFLCLFVNSVPLETTLRIWDMFFYDGVKALFRAGLTLLKINEKSIMKSQSSDQLMTFLKAFTRSALDCHAFMKISMDVRWIGVISSSIINELREKYRSGIVNLRNSIHLSPSGRSSLAAEESLEVESLLKERDESSKSSTTTTKLDDSKEGIAQPSWPFINESDDEKSESDSGTAYVDSKFASRLAPLNTYISRLSFQSLKEVSALASPDDIKSRTPNGFLQAVPEKAQPASPDVGNVFSIFLDRKLKTMGRVRTKSTT